MYGETVELVMMTEQGKQGKGEPVYSVVFASWGEVQGMQRLLAGLVTFDDMRLFPLLQAIEQVTEQVKEHGKSSEV